MLTDAPAFGYTAQEVADELGRSREWVKKWRARLSVGRIRGGAIVFTQDELEQLRRLPRLESDNPRIKAS